VIMPAIDRDPTPDPHGSPVPFDPVDSWRLIRMRWLAGLAMLIGTVGVAVFDQALPTIQLIALSLAVLGYNAAMAYALPRAGPKRLPLIVNGQIIFDWIALASFIHLTGGIESPAIFFFLFHLILVAMVFSAAITYRYAAVAIGVVIVIAGLEAIGWLPHYAVLIPPPSDLYRTPTYILAIVGFFGVTVGVVVFLVTRLMRALRDRERRLTALTRTLQAMSGSLDLPHVLNQIVTGVTHALEAKAASIRLLDQTGEQLTIAAAYGLSQAYLAKGPVTLGNSPIDQEALRGHPVIIDKTSQEQRFIYPEHILAEGIHSMMYAPLIGRRGPLGVLRVYGWRAGSFDEKDAEFVMTAARQGALSIENAMAYTELRHLDETKSQFVRTVTHELRGPVVGSQSLLRAVTRDLAGGLNDVQRDILRRLSDRLDALKLLIDDLLDLAAGKVEGLQTPLTPVSVEAIVLNIVDRLSTQAAEKQINLKMDYVPRGLTVMATEDGLHRIFLNLIGNAVKYTPPGGRVNVRMDQCEDEVVTAIIDTGVGIPAADLPHVFEEFYRASNVKQEGITGTGLGLAIVKDLVERYEGRISVHSTVGEGTTFTVVLPMAR
jgi:signal transduction histidine kinase